MTGEATDRHRHDPITYRPAPDVRERLEHFARDTGQPVRRVIADAVRAWLDRADHLRAVEARTANAAISAALNATETTPSAGA